MLSHRTHAHTHTNPAYVSKIFVENKQNIVDTRILCMYLCVQIYKIIWHSHFYAAPFEFKFVELRNAKKVGSQQFFSLEGFWLFFFHFAFSQNVFYI